MSEFVKRLLTISDKYIYIRSLSQSQPFISCLILYPVIQNSMLRAYLSFMQRIVITQVDELFLIWSWRVIID